MNRPTTAQHIGGVDFCMALVSACKPEQLMGVTACRVQGVLTEACDIYSLGVVRPLHTAGLQLLLGCSAQLPPAHPFHILQGCIISQQQACA